MVPGPVVHQRGACMKREEEEDEKEKENGQGNSYRNEKNGFSLAV